MRIVELSSEAKSRLLEDLLKRSPNSYGAYEGSVREILEKVKAEGDKALFAYTEQFDGAKIDAGSIEVSEEETAWAYAQVDASLLEVVRRSLKNIREYHEKQRQHRSMRV